MARANLERYVNLGILDSIYLRIDTSNDPLTGELTFLDPSGGSPSALFPPDTVNSVSRKREQGEFWLNYQGCFSLVASNMEQEIVTCIQTNRNGVQINGNTETGLIDPESFGQTQWP